MVASAMGDRVSAPSPIPMAIGIIPNIMAKVVISIGRSLTGPAWSKASLRAIPRSLNTFV